MRISDWSSDVCSSDLRSNCLAHIERLRGSGRARRYARMRCDREAILPLDNGINRCKTPLGIIEVDPGERGRHFDATDRSEEHTSDLQSLLRISYAVYCLKKIKSMNLTPTSMTPAAITKRMKTKNTSKK